MILVPGTSANPAIAAFPVSPDVAVRITISFFAWFLLCSRCHKVRQDQERHVLESDRRFPWNSSRKYIPSAFASGAISSVSNFLIVCGKYSILILLRYSLLGTASLPHKPFPDNSCLPALVHRYIQRRNALRNVEAAVICKSLTLPGMLSRQSPPPRVLPYNNCHRFPSSLYADTVVNFTESVAL